LSLAREDMRPVRVRRPRRTATQGGGRAPAASAGRRPGVKPAKVPATAGRAATKPAASRPAAVPTPSRGTAQHHTQRKAST
jgi:hypothetical protein